MGSIHITEWLHPFLVPFFSLSYPTDTPKVTDSFPNSAYYNTGPRDLCLVITCIAVMAILRDALRLGVFEPFARWKLSRDLNYRRQQRLIGNANGTSNGTVNGTRVANGKVNGLTNANGAINGKANGVSNGKVNGNGVGNSKANGNGVANVNGHITHGNASAKELRKLNRSVLRFAEQGWSVVYYTLQWSFGLYVHRNLPTRIFDPTDLWLNYPHIPIAAPIKLYYLTQNAFYIHQVLILNAEARRKDHVQMMAHHVITILLMGSSYYTHFTRVGCLIMVLMDWCDIFLPMAKMMRYIEIPQIFCDTTFAWFLVSWLVTRHFLFLFVIYSTYTDLPRLVTFLWSKELGRYLSRTTWIIFCALLSALQIIQVIWFGMICRVAWRVITTGSGASDDRSDDEGDDDQKDE